MNRKDDPIPEEYTLGTTDMERLFGLTEEMPILDKAKILLKPDGRMRSIQEVFSYLNSAYDFDTLPFEPSDCIRACQNTELAIASKLERVSVTNAIQFDDSRVKILSADDRDIVYGIDIFDELTSDTADVEVVATGRTYAEDDAYLLIIERPSDETITSNYKLALFQKAEHELVESVVVMDFRDGYNPVSCVQMFGAVTDQIHGVQNIENFMQICDRLTGYTSGGYLAGLVEA